MIGLSKIRVLPAASLIAAFICSSGSALAQTWPVRPVKFVVPYAPGVSPDVAARIVAEFLPKALGQSVVVENMPGANGFVGAQSVARAQPDGYTALVAPTTIMVNNSLMFKSLPYDAQRDFTPVQFLNAGGPFSVTVNADLPVRTLPDLIALAKSKPGEITYGVESSSSVVPMIARLIRKRTGMDVLEVPYKATSQLIQDVVAGRVNYTVGTPVSADPMVKAGKLRIIAVTTANRYEGLPDVMTVGETLPGFSVQGFMTLVVPSATPPEIMLRLNRAVATTLREPDLKRKLSQISVIPVDGATPEAVAEALRSERERWRGFVSELGVQPE